MSQSDIEIAKALSTDIGNEYEQALNKLQHDPVSSILRFRRVVEAQCQLISANSGLDISQLSLEKQIKELADHQLIHWEYERTLHEIRKLCNQQVHFSPMDSSQITSKDVSILQKDIQSQIRNRADHIRSKVISSIEDCYHAVKGEYPGAISPVDAYFKDWRQLLLEATDSSNWRKKKEAGMAVMAMIEQRRIEQFSEGQISGDIDSYFHLNLANSLLRTACIMSCKTDTHSTTYDYAFPSESAKKVYASEGDLDCLYAIWKISVHLIEDKNSKEVEWFLHAAANRKHPEAMCWLGGQLLIKGQLETARKLINESRMAGCIEAYAESYKLALQDGDLDEALAYLNSGCELNDSYAKFLKGEAYYEGHILDHDAVLGRELVYESICLGSIEAVDYWNDTIAPDLLMQFEEKARNTQTMLNLITGSTANKKEKGSQRNKPCACGSGRKYKHCCGS